MLKNILKRDPLEEQPFFTIDIIFVSSIRTHCIRPLIRIYFDLAERDSYKKRIMIILILNQLINSICKMCFTQDWLFDMLVSFKTI